MINLKFKKVFEGGDTKVLLTAQVINFLIIPFLAYGIGRLFWRELLSYFGNTYGRPCSYQWDDYFLDWFCQGKVEAAVKMTVVGLILGSLATLFYVDFLMSAHLKVDDWYIFKQILFVVFLPMITRYFTQKYLLKKYGPQ